MSSPLSIDKLAICFAEIHHTCVIAGQRLCPTWHGIEILCVIPLLKAGIPDSGSMQLDTLRAISCMNIGKKKFRKRVQDQAPVTGLSVAFPKVHDL
jgi:hypothetical protein